MYPENCGWSSEVFPERKLDLWTIDAIKRGLYISAKRELNLQFEKSAGGDDLLSAIRMTGVRVGCVDVRFE